MYTNFFVCKRFATQTLLLSLEFVIHQISSTILSQLPWINLIKFPIIVAGYWFHTLHKKWSFPLTMFLVNLSKSTVSCRCGRWLAFKCKMREKYLLFKNRNVWSNTFSFGICENFENSRILKYFLKIFRFHYPAIPPFPLRLKSLDNIFAAQKQKEFRTTLRFVERSNWILVILVITY